MTQLERPDGTVTDDPAEIRQLTHDFYTSLFSPDPISTECQNKLLESLPQLDDESKDMCDDPLSFEELTSAIKLISKDRSPGIDGLPGEFCAFGLVLAMTSMRF